MIHECFYAMYKTSLLFAAAMRDFWEFVIDLLPITFRSVSVPRPREACSGQNPRGRGRNPRGRGRGHNPRGRGRRFFGLEAEATPLPNIPVSSAWSAQKVVHRRSLIFLQIEHQKRLNVNTYWKYSVGSPSMTVHPHFRHCQYRESKYKQSDVLNYRLGAFIVQKNTKEIYAHVVFCEPSAQIWLESMKTICRVSVEYYLLYCNAWIQQFCKI